MIDIIPAIDLIEGRCVRLTQGDYARSKVYDTNPLDMAKQFADCGVRRLHIVDLDGAKAKQPSKTNLSALERIAAATTLDIEWGGGIKSEDAQRSVLNAGASRIICGSIAVEKPECFAEWLHNYGSAHIILGADVRNGRVAVNGWLEQSQMKIEELLHLYIPNGLTQMICTDIAKDGMLQGPDMLLYTGLQQEFPMVDITLSGGISCMHDIQKAQEYGIRAVITGKAIYEGKITLKEIEQWLLNA